MNALCIASDKNSDGKGVRWGVMNVVWTFGLVQVHCVCWKKSAPGKHSWELKRRSDCVDCRAEARIVAVLWPGF